MKKVLLFIALTITVIGYGQVKKAPQTTKPAPKTNTGSHAIALTLTPVKNQWVYLYNYYGKNFQVTDSVLLNANSQGVFKGNKKLPGGIYIVVNDRRSRLFDFLVGDEQNFSVKADTTKLDAVEITGSKENDLYTAYSKFLAEKTPRLNVLLQQYNTAKTKTDSTTALDGYRKANQELNDYRENIIKTHPTSMLALFFKTVKMPEAPAMPKLANGKLDSLFPGRYVKEHYWDNVDFGDDRLLRTPFFDKKMEDYFKYYVSPEPDSVIAEVNYILLSSRGGEDMFKYLLGRFTDKYINPEIMGQDKVFVFLFNNFFSKGDTTWLNDKQKEFIFNRAYSLMSNLIGEQAAVMNLVDSAGKAKPLYSIQAPFTFVAFWDPNCGHCKEMIPRVDSIYKATWKKQGVAVYAVNIDEEALPAWRKYIVEHKLNNWTHVYQPKEDKLAEQKAQKANFRQLYDVYQTPTFYLLDKDKRIIAKKLSLEQFNDLIQAKLKTPGP
jgi:thiol-disulfide isomerase/thioredoxin